jgi:hypothetical protein
MLLEENTGGGLWNVPHVNEGLVRWHSAGRA